MLRRHEAHPDAHKKVVVPEETKIRIQEMKDEYEAIRTDDNKTPAEKLKLLSAITNEWGDMRRELGLKG